MISKFKRASASKCINIDATLFAVYSQQNFVLKFIIGERAEHIKIVYKCLNPDLIIHCFQEVFEGIKTYLSILERPNRIKTLKSDAS